MENGLSPSHRRLAAHLLKNHRAAAFETAAALGRYTGVSEATVVRFASALGYRGFPDLQRELRQSVLQALTSLERLQEAPGTRAGRAGILEAVVRQEMENLEQVAALNSPATLGAWAQALRAAPGVAVAGMQASAALAQFFGFQLRKIRSGVVWFGTADISAYHQVARMGRRDCLCLFSFPRYPQMLVELARFARERGMRVLIMTDGELSPLAPLGSPTLYAPTTSPSFVDGYAAPVCLCNAIISQLAHTALRSSRRSLAAYELAAERACAFARVMTEQAATAHSLRRRR